MIRVGKNENATNGIIHNRNEDSFDRFLKDIHKYPKLSKEENIRLAGLARA
jgi:hypothetical protein